MLRLIFALVLAGLPDKPETQKLARSILATHEQNLASLTIYGSIHFQETDGVIQGPIDVNRMVPPPKQKWERRSPSVGMYVFDAPLGRYENIHSTEQLVGRRVRVGLNSTQSAIGSIRMLTDGESTLIDHIHVELDDRTVLHSPRVIAGSGEFYRQAEGIPLRMGNPRPGSYELRRCLSDAIEGREGAVLVEVDDRATFEGVRVVKIRVDHPQSPEKEQVTYWVDLARGALPLQSRNIYYVPHANTSLIFQINHHDLRNVGQGWLPFRYTVADGDLSREGVAKSLFVREYTVKNANFADRPDPSLFSLNFPKPYALSDGERRISFGSSETWSLEEIALQVRERDRLTRMPAKEEASNIPKAENAPSRLADAVVAFSGILLLIVIVKVVRRVLGARRQQETADAADG